MPERPWEPTAAEREEWDHAADYEAWKRWMRTLDGGMILDRLENERLWVGLYGIMAGVADGWPDAPKMTESPCPPVE